MTPVGRLPGRNPLTAAPEDVLHYTRAGPDGNRATPGILQSLLEPFDLTESCGGSAAFRTRSKPAAVAPPRPDPPHGGLTLSHRPDPPAVR